MNTRLIGTAACILALAIASNARSQVPPPNLPPPGAYQPIPNYTGTNAGLQFRTAINDRFSGVSPISPKVTSLNFASLPAEQDGLLSYCADCQETSPCGAGGQGAWAFGAQGQWQCTAPAAAPIGTAGGDLGGTYPGPTVTATHLSSPLPTSQGGRRTAVTSVIDVTAGASPAHGDGQINPHGQMTQGSNVIALTSTFPSTFSAARDIGLAVFVSNEGLNGTVAAGTITSVTDSTHAVASFTAQATLSNLRVTWGHDDTSAINAHAALVPANGVLYFPAAAGCPVSQCGYILNGTIVPPSGVITVRGDGGFFKCGGQAFGVDSCTNLSGSIIWEVKDGVDAYDRTFSGGTQIDAFQNIAIIGPGQWTPLPDWSASACTSTSVYIRPANTTKNPGKYVYQCSTPGAGGAYPDFSGNGQFQGATVNDGAAVWTQVMYNHMPTGINMGNVAENAEGGNNTWRNVFVANFPVGAVWHYVEDATLNTVWFEGNLVGFWAAHGSNQNVAINFNAQSNDIGLSLASANTWSFKGGLLQSSTYAGMVLNQVGASTFDAFHCEANTSFCLAEPSGGQGNGFYNIFLNSSSEAMQFFDARDVIGSYQCGGSCPPFTFQQQSGGFLLGATPSASNLNDFSFHGTRFLDEDWTTYTPALGGTVTPDFSQGGINVIVASSGSAFTIAAPANYSFHHPYRLRIYNNSGGTLGAVTFNSFYVTNGFIAPPNGVGATAPFTIEQDPATSAYKMVQTGPWTRDDGVNIANSTLAGPVVSSIQISAIDFPGLVSQNRQTSGSDAATCSGNVTVPITISGGFVALDISTSGNVATPLESAVTEDNGGTWHKAISQGNGATSSYSVLYYSYNHPAGATNVTVALSGGSGSCEASLTVSDWKNIQSGSDPLDQVGTQAAGGSSGANNVSSGTTPATTQASELTIAVASMGGAHGVTAGPTNSFTELTDPSNANGVSQFNAYRVVNALGTYNTQWSTGDTVTYKGLVATFKGVLPVGITNPASGAAPATLTLPSNRPFTTAVCDPVTVSGPATLPGLCNTIPITMAASATLTMPACSQGEYLALQVAQNGTGGFTPTFAAPTGWAIKWSGGSAPTPTTTANKTDWYGFFCDAVNKLYWDTAFRPNE